MLILKIFVLVLFCRADHDWRNVNGVNYISKMQIMTNPQNCLADWAFTASALVSDTMGVDLQDTQRPKATISPQVLMNCATPLLDYFKACDRGNITWALQHMVDQGTVDDTCMGNRGKKEICDAINFCVECYPLCQKVTSYVLYKAKSYATFSPTETNLIAAITKQPVACELMDYSVVLVGYQNSAGPTTFIAKTNFGTFYKQGGYETIAMDAITGSCYTVTMDYNSTGVAEYTFPPISRAELDNAKLLELVHQQEHPLAFPTEPVTAVNSPLPRTAATIQDSLDWRFDANGVVQVTPVRSHHIGPQYCGACYAFASSSTFSDVVKIATGKSAEDIMLSPQDVIDCAPGDDSHRGHCQGNSGLNVFNYYVANGTVDESCNPYTSVQKQCGISGGQRCMKCDPQNPYCSPETTHKKFYGKRAGSVSGEADMLMAIQNGPLECMMATPEEFHNLSGGDVFCYNGTAIDSKIISHDVEILGYGKDKNDQKYWIGRNSWGTKWGDEGFFKICRGTNNLQIEKECAWIEFDEERSVW